MPNAKIDNNWKPTLIGVSSADGDTPTRAEIDPVSGGLLVDIVAGGGSGGTSSNFNNTFPASGTAVGASDGTNMKPLLVDGSGYLEVNVKAGSGSGLSVQDEAAWTAGTSNFVPGGGVFNDSATALTSGQQGTARLSPNRAAHSNLRNNSGTEVGTATTPLQVSLANTGANTTAVKTDGSAVTQPVSGTFWQATQPVSGTVTANAGTNLNTSALALETGGNLAAIKTDVDKIPSQGQALAAASMPVVLTAAQITTLTPPAAITNYALETGGNLATLAGAVTSSVVQENVKQINGVTPLMGNGTTGTGSQRVTIASDNTAFSVNANAGTNLNTSALALESGGNLDDIDAALDNIVAQETTTSGLKGLTVFGAVTTAAPTYTTLKSDALSLTTGGALREDITTIAGTAPTTAGKIDIKGADGDVFVRQATAANLNATVVGTGTFAVQATESGTWTVGSNSATGSAVPANAFYEGLLAKTANPTAASDGNLIGALADKLGKQVVVGSIRDLKGNQFTTITSSTSETTVVTQVTSTFLDVYGVIVENTSATASKVTFKDSTSGTTQFEIYVPAGDTRGFMLPESGAFKQTTVNTNWTATCGTSVASIVISVLYVKNI